MKKKRNQIIFSMVTLASFNLMQLILNIVFYILLEIQDLYLKYNEGSVLVLILRVLNNIVFKLGSIAIYAYLFHPVVLKDSVTEMRKSMVENYLQASFSSQSEDCDKTPEKKYF